MRTTTARNFYKAGFFFVRATWPYPLGEVLAQTLMPLTKRLVLMLLLLGNFRYLTRNADPDLSTIESLTLLWPIVISVIAVMVAPLAIATFSKLASRGRRRKTNPEIKREYCRLLFDKDEVVDNWEQYYEGLQAIMIYIVFILVISPAFLYYSWRIYIVYLTVAILFGTLCAKRINLSEEHKFGRLFNKFVDSNVYLNTLRYAALSIYIIACGLVIVFMPHRLPVEFVLVIIIGMRLLLGRGKKVVAFFLWEAGKPVPLDDDDS